MPFPILPARIGLLSGLVLLLAMTAFPSGRNPRATIPAAPAPLAFRDMAGTEHRLADRSELPAVYLFISTQCPIANLYTPRILALEKAYRARGVHFLAVYANANETPDEIRRHTRERRYRFPIIRDDGVLAARLGAKMTPEAVLLDSRGAIRYVGRIDDNKDTGQVRLRDLKNALDAVLAGRPVPRARAAAFGCALRTASPVAAKPARITYTRDVAPILQRNCISCHRQGEVAPFSLESYRQAAAWAQSIKQYTANRKMPPWKADSHGEFANERRLTDREIATLAAWADVGAPQGNPKDLPAAPTFPSGWRLGAPDEIVRLPEPYQLAADGRDVYRCFVLPTGYNADRWLSALEFHPGNRRVVHHIIAYLDTSGAARKLAAKENGSSYSTSGGGPGFVPSAFLGGWAPGNEPGYLPTGVGILLPKGGDIVLEVHYHKNGKPETDRSEVGLHFCKGPVDKRLRIMMVVNFLFRLPPGKADCVVKAGAPVFQDITVLGITPHMHLLGREMEVTAALPDKTRRQMVRVPDWDFNWQLTYGYREPVRLPAGTQLELSARYDNSPANPYNPNKPPRAVGWGEQTTDEMCIAFLGYTVDSEHLTRGVKGPPASLFEIGRL